MWIWDSSLEQEFKEQHEDSANLIQFCGDLDVSFKSLIFVIAQDLVVWSHSMLDGFCFHRSVGEDITAREIFNYLIHFSLGIITDVPSLVCLNMILI